MIIDKVRKRGAAVAWAAVMAALVAGTSLAASAAPTPKATASDTLPQRIDPDALHESGAVVNWLNSRPSGEDLDQYHSAKAR